jgi:hypothetical protein
MNFLLGLSLIAILIPFNRFALKIINKLPPSASQAILFAMLIGNMLFALTWALGLEPEVTNMTSFLMGIGLASLINMGYKITYLMIFHKKN